MSEKAIQKLKKKIVLVSMAALTASMMLIAGLLYYGNHVLNRQVIKSNLNYIIENNGDLINWADAPNSKSPLSRGYIRVLEDIFSTDTEYKSPEFRYSTKYFAILFDAEGQVEEVKTNYLSDITEKEATAYGRIALESWKSFSRCDNYYYQKKVNDDGSAIVVYIDGESIFLANERFLYLALMLIGFGMVVAVLLVRVFATKAVQNELKNAELQKKFMTNASHELKTPLAVIKANTEMMEILSGENEWTESTLRQVERMNGLIKNLVMITRAEENSENEVCELVDVTKAVTESVDNFKSMAMQDDKALNANIAENVKMFGNEAQIRQLAGLFVDNAIKYCDAKGSIDVTLSQKGKGIILTVSNDYAEGEHVDYTKFFERFYREDESHNVDKGGYGIGLSIAESLVKHYRGKIDVEWKAGKITFTSTLRPMLK